MKKSILILAMIGFALQLSAQDVVNDTQIEKENVPVEIVKAVNVDFPGYVVERFMATPVHYVDQDVFISNFDDPTFMDSYQVTLTNKDRNIIANYREDGELMNSVENLKDIAPPAAVRNTIAKNFPGWTISKDTYHMIKRNGENKKERYGFVLQKDGKKRHIYTDESGKILK